MEKIYKIMPNGIQNTFVSLFNWLAYRKRYGGQYKSFLQSFRLNRNLSLLQLREDQSKRFATFVAYAVRHSEFYKHSFERIQDITDINNISKLPILTKEILRVNIDKVVTISPFEAIISKTGGTTGKSLAVWFSKANMQERFAMLDDFRGRFGYKLGKKTAWFSGKNLLSDSDVKRHQFWKSDYIHNVRYYSTFHIKYEYMEYYVKNLLEYSPEYIVGFPSTMLEIAKYAIGQNIFFPKGRVKAIFPTAETITDECRSTLEAFFNTNLYDQYASSEGAPFIFQCYNKKLHLELQSGVFEVLDQNDSPTNFGRLVVTSFTTYGTPLIRYDIGDEVELSDETCDCGNNNPLVKRILGRKDDFVYSPTNGKINLGNISNTLKDTKGIIRFQVIQNTLDVLVIKVVVDNNIFNKNVEEVFLKNWRARVGNDIVINLDYVPDIPVEASGKFRMVKTSISHLLN